jgi:hypothetical protein
LARPQEGTIHRDLHATQALYNIIVMDGVMIKTLMLERHKGARVGTCSGGISIEVGKLSFTS